MEGITLGQIGLGIGFLVSLISGISFLGAKIKHWISDSMKEQMDQIGNRLDDLQGRIDNVDMESCKNFLVNFLSRIERGVGVDEIERERFWEQYEHYQKHGGNSYIKRKVETLKSENKL